MGEKFTDAEHGYRRNSADQETAFNDQDETVKFLPKSTSGPSNGPSQESGAGATGSKSEKKKEHSDEFYGLTRDQLQNYANDPKWVKIRIILFVVFVLCWAGMLVAAIVIVVVTPKCPPTPNLSWYQTGVMYKVDGIKFQDSEGDGKGDIKGIQSRVDHFSDLKVKTLWVKDIVSPDNMEITNYGSLDEFRELTKTLKKKGIRTVVDFNIKDFAHFSDKHKLTDSQFHSGNDAALIKLDNLVRDWTRDGVEGFVVYLPDNVDKDFYSNVTLRWQNILNEEFNRKDDRERVIIKGDITTASEVIPYLYQPYQCAVSNCDIQNLEELAAVYKNSSNEQISQMIPQIKALTASPLCTLVQRLTVPGTPNVEFGDEIGVGGDYKSRQPMVWDDTVNHGFSNSSTTITGANVSSVLAQKSVGFTGVSLYSLFKKLAEVRYKEPSLKWGALKIYNFAVGAISYVREAKGFPPVAVAMNPTSKGVSGKLVYDQFTHAEVLAVSGVNLEVGAKVDLSAVYLPENSILVARLEENEEKK